MKQPEIAPAPVRDIDGEIVYLDYMRRMGKSPKQYRRMASRTRDSFEAEATYYQTRGERPAIMDDYDREDAKADWLCVKAVALADVFLEHRDPKTQLTFEDFRISDTDDAAIAMIQQSAVGKALLAGPETQFAIPSDGSYYPALDVRRRDLEAGGACLRVWGWDDPKIVFTNEPGTPRVLPTDRLTYPNDEKEKRRQLDLCLTYRHPDLGAVTETLSCYVTNTSCRLSVRYFASCYAETGYEGHGGKQIDPTDEAMSDFLDLVAQLAGDEPESFREYDNRKLAEFTQETIGTPYGVEVRRSIKSTWPAQAVYLLLVRPFEELDNKTIQEAIRDSTEKNTKVLDVLRYITAYYKPAKKDPIQSTLSDLNVTEKV